MFGSNTARISRAPRITRISCGFILICPRPILRLMITNAAIIPPTSLPLPPDVEIPQNTAIAIASISNPLPVVVFAPYSTDVRNKAARPDINPSAV